MGDFCGWSVSLGSLMSVSLVDRISYIHSLLYDARHEKIDLKVFVVVIPKEGWARVAALILLLA